MPPSFTPLTFRWMCPASWNRMNGVYRCVRLGAKGVTVQTGTATGSAAIARKLGAVHLVLDYPSGDTVEVRRFDGVNPVAHCPLEDWLFWPALTPVAPR